MICHAGLGTRTAFPDYDAMKWLHQESNRFLSEAGAMNSTISKVPRWTELAQIVG